VTALAGAEKVIYFQSALIGVYLRLSDFDVFSSILPGGPRI
jgi:hypothetical protein